MRISFSFANSYLIIIIDTNRHCFSKKQTRRRVFLLRVAGCFYNLLFFKKPLAKDANILRRTTIIGRSGNNGSTPFPTTAAIRLVFRTAAIPTARLRRLRIARLCRLRIARLCRLGITRLCRCRVRLYGSRSSRFPRITGLYRRNWRGRCNRCRVGRRHSSRTVAGTAAFVSLVAGRDLLRLFDSHFVVGTLLTGSRRDGCIPRRNGSYLPIGINGSDLLVAGRPLDGGLGGNLFGGQQLP